MSPGLDFETKLIARPDAPAILEKELRNPRYVPAMIAIGSNTDPYQPIEKEHQIMRGILEVLARFNHPVAIITKGTKIERDVDILGPMAAKGLVRVGMSITTNDNRTSRAMEPRVPLPGRRLLTIRRLTDASIPVRVMVSPVVPALTDHELEAILAAAKEAGAFAASSIVLRLPREVSVLSQDWLAEAFPDRAARVMARVRELHGGQDYDPAFGTQMTGQEVGGFDAAAVSACYAQIRIGPHTDRAAVRSVQAAATSGRSVEFVLSPRRAAATAWRCGWTSAIGAIGF